MPETLQNCNTLHPFHIFINVSLDARAVARFAQGKIKTMQRTCHIMLWQNDTRVFPIRNEKKKQIPPKKTHRKHTEEAESKTVLKVYVSPIAKSTQLIYIETDGLLFFPSVLWPSKATH